MAERPPTVGVITDADDLARRLQDLRTWAGVSYRELHRRVVRDRRHRGVVDQPAYDTVYRCLQAGRSRLDPDLVTDIARVLDVDPTTWRRAAQQLMVAAGYRSIVEVTDLPPPTRPFVGRSATLSAALRRPQPVTLVSGLAGVGKTAFAIELAHRLLRARPAPEVAVFVDLAGFDPEQPPVSPGAALGGLLRRLGVPLAQATTPDLDRRRALVRDALADRRVLVLLDNAASESQVAPLLDLDPRVRTIVTSRLRLDLGFARDIELDVLSPAASMKLLAVGTTVAASPHRSDLAELAELLDHLPLALTVVARRIAQRPEWRVGDHVAQIREFRANRRLVSGVDTSLRLSYDDLGPDDRRLLRGLTLPSGSADIGVHAAAALAGVDVVDARQTLERLTRAHLVRDLGPSRWDLHDLVKVFGAARSVEEDPLRLRDEALDRLDACHEMAAAAAMDLYAPLRSGTRPAVHAEPGISVPALGSPDEARDWLGQEIANLIAGALHAVDRGRVQHAATMTWLLGSYIQLNFPEAADDLHQAVARATTGLDRGRALNGLGAIYASTGRLTEARDVLLQARAIAEFAADPERMRHNVSNLAGISFCLGDYAAALAFSEHALVMSRTVGKPALVYGALSNVGLTCERLGRLDEAAALHREALDLARGHGDRVGEGRSLQSLAVVRRLSGDLEDARNLATAALAIARETRYALGEAEAMGVLATLDSLAGNHDTAVAEHRRCLQLVAGLGVAAEEARMTNDLVASLLRGSRHDEARSLVGEALVAGSGDGDPYEQARALVAAARIAAIDGLPAKALDLDRQVAQLCAGLGCPVPELPLDDRVGAT